ncbi:MAG: acyl carrier protein [Bacteroidales bacterium]|jgi:acyl carrier protein|nr:acyl carrier protein [Bacteroidales bacterium]
MVNLEQVKDQIRQFIVETTFAPAEQVKNETLIFVEGIFDSMGFVSLINYIEETFAIKAKDSELLEDNFESIDAIARFIESKLN